MRDYDFSKFSGGLAQCSKIRITPSKASPRLWSVYGRDAVTGDMHLICRVPDMPTAKDARAEIRAAILTARKLAGLE